MFVLIQVEILELINCIHERYKNHTNFISLSAEALAENELLSEKNSCLNINRYFLPYYFMVHVQNPSKQPINCTLILLLIIQ